MSRNPKHQPHQIALGEAIQTTITGEDVPAGVVAAEAAHNAATEPVQGIAARVYVVRLRGAEVARFARYFDAEAHALDLARRTAEDGAVSLAEVQA